MYDLERGTVVHTTLKIIYLSIVALEIGSVIE